MDYNFSLNLTVQRKEPKGCILQVEGLVTRDLWLDFSDTKKYIENEYPVILPRHINKFIKNAISNGWESHKTGKPFNFEVVNETLQN